MPKIAYITRRFNSSSRGDRLNIFTRGEVRLERLALNMDQVEQYNPPPNPAKTTDSRFDGYIREYGDESWELDALEPRVLAELVRGTLDGIRDEEKWAAASEREATARAQLQQVSDRWDDITENL